MGASPPSVHPPPLLLHKEVLPHFLRRALLFYLSCKINGAGRANIAVWRAANGLHTCGKCVNRNMPSTTQVELVRQMGLSKSNPKLPEVRRGAGRWKCHL